MNGQEARKHRLTQGDCDTVRLLLERQRTLKEIADIIRVDPSTVGKIRLADYNLDKYLEKRKEMNRKTKERKAREKEAFENADKHAEEDQQMIDQLRRNLTDGFLHGAGKVTEALDGQIRMNLEPEEKKPEEKTEMTDLTKLMRFMAAQNDRYLKKMDELIATLMGRNGNGHQAE